MYNSITIENFRGIDKLEISQLGRVNLFCGKNNVGKTSVLESFFLLTGLSYPNLPMKINLIRTKTGEYNVFLKYLFHGVDLSRKPSFHATLDSSEERKLTLAMATDLSVESTASELSSETSSSDASFQAGQFLDLSFSVNSPKQNLQHGTNRLYVNPNGKTIMKMDPNYQEKRRAMFVPSGVELRDLPNLLSNWVKRNEKEKLLAYARLFDERITNIEILSDGIYIGYNGMKELLPLGLCDEGLKKYLTVIGVTSGANYEIILLDELENGLHFSAYAKLWDALLQLAGQCNIQLMITTHSKEVLEALNYSRKITKAIPSPDDICVFTLAQTKLKGLQAYRYAGDAIDGIVEHNLEVRE